MLFTTTRDIREKLDQKVNIVVREQTYNSATIEVDNNTKKSTYYVLEVICSTLNGGMYHVATVQPGIPEFCDVD